MKAGIEGVQAEVASMGEVVKLSGRHLRPGERQYTPVRYIPEG